MSENGFERVAQHPQPADQQKAAHGLHDCSTFGVATCHVRNGCPE